MWGVWGYKVCSMLCRSVKTMWRACWHTGMAFAAFLKRQRYPFVYRSIGLKSFPFARVSSDFFSIASRFDIS